MTAPDRIWMYASALNNPSLITCGDTEYARVIPDTITLPRAEVEALMATLASIDRPLLKVGRWMDMRIAARAALAALQERMK